MKKIELSFSCDQKWDDMENLGLGNKHCNLCNKTIVDFESMSDDEVIHYIQNFSSSKTCGKITSNKLAAINRKLKCDAMKEQNQKFSLPIFKSQYFIFPAIAAFIFNCNHISAQIHNPTSTEAIVPADKDKIKSSTITKFKFEGQITDEDRNSLILVYIALMEDGKQIMSTESDIDGKFNFVFDWKKDSTYSILVKYLGYQDIQYTLSKKSPNATLILKEYEVGFLGDIIIKNAVPPQNDIPEYKTWYNSMGNWFKKW